MEPEKKHRLIKYSIAAIAILVAVGFCVGIIYAVADYYANEDDTTAVTQNPVPEITGGDILDYFVDANDDGLYVSFVHGANSISEMEKALSDDLIDMLEADITLRYYGLENQTTEPIMAHPPAFNSDNTLANWFENVIPSKKGIKMDIKVKDVIPHALKELQLHRSKLMQPVWINADVIQGPNTLSIPIDGEYFLHNVNQYFPNVTLSLGWTTGYRIALENEEYSWESMDDMLRLASSTNQRITFPIRAALARQSWYKFLWLLEQDKRFSLTVWSASVDPVSLEDKVYLRDNYDTSRVFYDTDPNFVEDIKMEVEGDRTVEKVFYTGGNALDFFRIPGRDAMKVTWAHRANNKADLEAALKDESIMMLEADVRTRPSDGIPVMAHTPADIPLTDQTLEEWLQRVSNVTTKGIKLDVKTTDTLEKAFTIIAKESPVVPVWLNSDVLRGPNSVSIPVNATIFFSKAEEIFPHATLSPGWTTFYNVIGENEGYSQAMVEEMYSYCKSSRQAITFPVRASLTAQSVTELQWLIKKSNRYTLTVWHSGSENVPIEDLLKIHDGFTKEQVYYDLPEDMMNEFVQALESR
ncbi:protein FAM151A-like [Styela clava]